MALFKKIRHSISILMRGLSERLTGCGHKDDKLNSPACYTFEALSRLVREAAAEGCVLLKNDGALPLKKDAEVAVFGRCQLDWFFLGYGSGGEVRAPYTVNLMDGMKNAGAKYNESLAEAYKSWCEKDANRAEFGWWGRWPFSHPEMPVSKAAVEKAAESSDTAVVVIGRAAGEDRDNIPEEGSYYLTKAERELLKNVSESFKKTVVVLNVGSIMDLSWTEEYPISAVLIAWLGGQESGNAVCDVLYGDVNPSGRLPDTAARELFDYPSTKSFGGRKFTDYDEDIFVGYRYFDAYSPNRVLFGFGHGLSYTDFSIEPVGMVRTKTGVIASVRVKNTGGFDGKTAVLLFAFPPKEGLKKPVRVLAAFTKTRLLKPGECENVTLVCDNKSFSCFDEARSAFVLPKGEYRFEVNGTEVGGFTVNEPAVIESCERLLLPPTEPSAELHANLSSNLKERIIKNLPAELEAIDEKPSFSDAVSADAGLDRFIASLDEKELEALTRGHGMMNSPLGIRGNAGVLGGVSGALAERGVPALSLCDGPAGLRIFGQCTMIPCGTALAASFNTELVERLHTELGHEMEFFGADVRLAPGMNLHRSPLGGRNFEYFSEDPVLTGRMAAACVRGIESTGRAACPKHFACNNQEYKRKINDSRVSVRALRELYLRGFEICVKEGMPSVIMTSYNKINGTFACYNYDLATGVLRDEWDFEGVVITDWWVKSARSPEFKRLRDDAYRVRAGVDVLMPGAKGHFAKKYKSDGRLLKSLGKPDGITKAELQRTAKRVLKLVMKLKKIN